MNRQLCATPRTCGQWQNMDFQTAERCVKKLQMRIAKAAKEQKWGKVKALQWTLTHSFYGKALAVKQVTENKDKRISGVDHERWESQESKYQAIRKLSRRGYRAQPLRKVYRKEGNDKRRSLLTPTMTDRAMQTLHRFALEPVAEATADLHSYGFRPQRCAQDAVERCFQTLSKKRSPVWILKGRINGSWDDASCHWIGNHIPMDKRVLHQFLKQGSAGREKWFFPEGGTARDGSIFATIGNMALDGLEPMLRKHFKPCWIHGKSFYPAVNYTRYGNDFIITGATPELLVEEVIPIVRRFLKTRGLTLSEEKTCITHVDDGCDFLGCNIRKYSGKLLIKPAKAEVMRFLAKIRGIIRQNRSITQKDLILKLNPVIREWVAAHRFQVSSTSFHYADAQIFHALWRWAKRRHHNKGAKWIARRYFHSVGGRNWTFAECWKREDGTTGYCSLEYASDTKIARFPCIRDGMNPYEKAHQAYFRERETMKMRITVNGNSTLRRLFHKQRGLCALCGEQLTLETGGRCHKYRHGPMTANYLVHPDCHRKLHHYPSFQPAYCGSNRL